LPSALEISLGPLRIGSREQVTLQDTASDERLGSLLVDHGKTRAFCQLGCGGTQRFWITPPENLVGAAAGTCALEIAIRANFGAGETVMSWTLQTSGVWPSTPSDPEQSAP
jgi:hypothetical protein